MKNLKGFAVSISFLSLVACSQPQTPTTYGAAAGGVLGAGIGAIVGSQVGNAGAGLAIGAASGAAAGAAIGYAIEGQDTRIAANEERLNRQEETIKAQRTELASLRGVKSDSGYSGSSYTPPSTGSSFGGSAGGGTTRFATAAEIAAARAAASNDVPRARMRAETFSQPAPEASKPVEFSKPTLPTTKTSGSLVERDLVAPTAQIDASGNATNSFAVNQAIDSTECTNADAEIQKADKVSDSSDKLFHIRRALRLCPSNAGYHSKLGDLYLSMNRSDDARFEFQEALRLEPGLASAQNGLEGLQRGGNVAAKDVTFGGGEAPKLPSSKARY